MFKEQNHLFTYITYRGCVNIIDIKHGGLNWMG